MGLGSSSTPDGKGCGVGWTELDTPKTVLKEDVHPLWYVRVRILPSISVLGRTPNLWSGEGSDPDRVLVGGGW